MEKSPDITKPHYGEHILRDLWPFIILTFYCIGLSYHMPRITNESQKLLFNPQLLILKLAEHLQVFPKTEHEGVHTEIYKPAFLKVKSFAFATLSKHSSNC